uniref:Reverse transcriptase domain-containing protein n=1 Tax=Erpetoichthys calabaricus TaxID=27687 RepID=A0A8C4TCL9_ERPCA
MDKKPELDTLCAEELDKPLTLSELLDTINSLQNEKAPGPDGYPAELYKTFSVKLALLLLDLLQCASYRPISLLNNDVKILSKALGRRIEKILPSVISQDQTGFIKDRLNLASNL